MRPASPAPGQTQDQHLQALGNYEWGWADSDVAGATAQRGLTPEIVANISGLKSEPQWMLDLRLKGHRLFNRKPMPTWGAELPGRTSNGTQVMAVGILLAVSAGLLAWSWRR